MGTNTHGRDFDMIVPALSAIAARHPAFRLAVIGVHDDPLPDWAERIAVPQNAKSYHRFVPWLKSVASGFDFAIAPLEDAPFSRYKSGLKLLDNLGLGLPVLASDVPTYRKAATGLEGITLVPNTAKAWESALDAQLTAAPAAASRCDNLRRVVLKKFGLSDTLADFDRMVAEGLTGSRKQALSTDQSKRDAC